MARLELWLVVSKATSFAAQASAASVGPESAGVAVAGWAAACTVDVMGMLLEEVEGVSTNIWPAPHQRQQFEHDLFNKMNEMQS